MHKASDESQSDPGRVDAVVRRVCGCICECEKPIYHQNVCADCWLRVLREDDDHNLPTNDALSDV